MQNKLIDYFKKNEEKEYIKSLQKKDEIFFRTRKKYALIMAITTIQLLTIVLFVDIKDIYIKNTYIGFLLFSAIGTYILGQIIFYTGISEIKKIKKFDLKKIKKFEKEKLFREYQRKNTIAKEKNIIFSIILSCASLFIYGIVFIILTLLSTETHDYLSIHLIYIIIVAAIITYAVSKLKSNYETIVLKKESEIKKIKIIELIYLCSIIYLPLLTLLLYDLTKESLLIFILYFILKIIFKIIFMVTKK